MIPAHPTRAEQSDYRRQKIARSQDGSGATVVWVLVWAFVGTAIYAWAFA